MSGLHLPKQSTYVETDRQHRSLSINKYDNQMQAATGQTTQGLYSMYFQPPHIMRPCSGLA
jgi:hypothetical protein